VELQVLLHAPPPLDRVVERIAALELEGRKSVLLDIAPIVLASHQGERERDIFFELAQRCAIPRPEAERMLG
jgi:hypothetical protein